MRETFGNYLSGHKHIQTSLVPIVSKSIMVVVVVVEDDVVVVDTRNLCLKFASNWISKK